MISTQNFLCACKLFFMHIILKSGRTELVMFIISKVKLYIDIKIEAFMHSSLNIIECHANLFFMPISFDGAANAQNIY